MHALGLACSPLHGRAPEQSFWICDDSCSRPRCLGGVVGMLFAGHVAPAVSTTVSSALHCCCNNQTWFSFYPATRAGGPMALMGGRLGAAHACQAGTFNLLGQTTPHTSPGLTWIDGSSNTVTMATMMIMIASMFWTPTSMDHAQLVVAGRPLMATVY